MKFQHTLAFSFALIALFIALDMTGVTRGIPDSVNIAAMAFAGLAFAVVMSKRQPKP